MLAFHQSKSFAQILPFFLSPNSSINLRMRRPSSPVLSSSLFTMFTRVAFAEKLNEIVIESVKWFYLQSLKRIPPNVSTFQPAISGKIADSKENMNNSYENHSNGAT